MGPTQALELSVEDGLDAGARLISSGRYGDFDTLVVWVHLANGILGRGWCPRHRPLPTKESLRKLLAPESRCFPTLKTARVRWLMTK